MSHLTESPNKNDEELLKTGEFPKKPIEAYFINNQVIVFNPIHGSLLYGFGRYYGMPVGIRKPKNHIFNRPLQLSLFDALFLMENNKIKVYISKSNPSLSILGTTQLIIEKNLENQQDSSDNNVDNSSNQTELNIKEFRILAAKSFPSFEEKYEIYKDLRSKNYIPRPGQKFGADFIVYKQGPGIDHSSFCIQVLTGSPSISSIDVVRAGRLANSVKKRFVLANPTTKTYFQFKWFKP